MSMRVRKVSQVQRQKLEFRQENGKNRTNLSYSTFYCKKIDEFNKEIVQRLWDFSFLMKIIHCLCPKTGKLGRYNIFALLFVKYVALSY